MTLSEKTQLIKDTFNKFNALIFENRLESNFDFKVSTRAKRWAGAVKVVGRNQYEHVTEFKISLKTFDEPLARFEDVVIHEMIHVHHIQMRIQEKNRHGRRFVELMDAINNEYNRDVDVVFRPSTNEFKEHIKCEPIINKNDYSNFILWGDNLERLIIFSKNLDRKQVLSHYENYLGVKAKVGIVYSSKQLSRYKKTTQRCLIRPKKAYSFDTTKAISKELIYD